MSFESPEYNANANAIGVLRLLEAIRILGMETETRFGHFWTLFGGLAI